MIGPSQTIRSDGQPDEDDDHRPVVECDEACGAFVNPIGIDEILSTLRHWEFHSVNGGCAHGY